jgi:deoxyxylulose-5-phosphate synthase
LLPLEAIAVPLNARTRNSVIDSMVELAAQTGWLWDPKAMAEAVHAREDMHPTALENGVARGGFGSGVEEFLVSRAFKGRILRLGWPDEFIPHGDTATLMREYGLTPETLAAAVEWALKEGGR